MSASKLERLLNLTAALLDTPRPLTAEQLRQRVPGYPSDAVAFHRAFERDTDDLRELGIPLRRERGQPCARDAEPRIHQSVERDDARAHARTGDPPGQLSVEQCQHAHTIRPATCPCPHPPALSVPEVPYMEAMSLSTRSSTALNGSLQSTVRWAWSLSFRCTQSTV